ARSPRGRRRTPCTGRCGRRRRRPGAPAPRQHAARQGRSPAPPGAVRTAPGLLRESSWRASLQFPSMAHHRHVADAIRSRRTPKAVREPAGREALGIDEDEYVLGLLHLGFADREWAAPARDEREVYTRFLD